jgi:hypothetical protein
MNPAFEGFDPPNYTQVPDQFLDEWMPQLTGAQIKVFLYVCRRTLGFKKRVDAVSLEQLSTGIVKRNGERLDGGTGLHKASVVRAARELEELGLISRVQQKDAPTLYRLRFRGDQPQEQKPETTVYSMSTGAHTISRHEKQAESPTLSDTNKPRGFSTPSTGAHHNKQFQQTVKRPASSRVQSSVEEATQEPPRPTRPEETESLPFSPDDRAIVQRAIEWYGLGSDDDVITRTLKIGEFYGALPETVAGILYDIHKKVKGKPRLYPRKLGWFPDVVENFFKDRENGAQAGRPAAVDPPEVSNHPPEPESRRSGSNGPTQVSFDDFKGLL